MIGFATPAVSNTLTTSPDLRPYVVDVLLGRPLDSQSLPDAASRVQAGRRACGHGGEARQLKPTPRQPRRPVFMGVIDDGIAFANERFRLSWTAASTARASRTGG